MQLLVKAIRGPDSYERYVFADGLPEDLKVGIFYAGPGTFWAHLKGFEQAMLGKLVSERATGEGNSSKRVTVGGPERQND